MSMKRRLEEAENQLRARVLENGELRQRAEQACELQAQAERRLAEAEQVLSEKQGELQQIDANQRDYLEDYERRLRERYEGELEAVVRQHQEFVAQMRRNFADLERIDAERYQRICGDYQELLEVHESRPPRQQDVILIENLRRELGVVNEELKYLILEVINREEMYNKTFTSTRDLEFLRKLEALKARCSQDAGEQRRFTVLLETIIGQGPASSGRGENTQRRASQGLIEYVNRKRSVHQNDELELSIEMGESVLAQKGFRNSQIVF